jgi:DNA-binding NtrC family response regulator
MSAKTILVVDDEIGIRELLSEILFDEGYQVVLAENAREARAFRNQQTPDLVLLDIWMPDTDGIALLKEWAAAGQLTMPVIMMSGHGTVETAVEATRIGAIAFLEKPVALQKLLEVVAHAIRHGTPQSVPEEAAPESPLYALPLDLPLREARDYFDTLYFNYHMEKEGGNISRVAYNVGLERTHLYRKLKQLGIKFPRKNKDEA